MDECVKEDELVMSEKDDVEREERVNQNGGGSMRVRKVLQDQVYRKVMRLDGG